MHVLRTCHAFVCLLQLLSKLAATAHKPLRYLMASAGQQLHWRCSQRHLQASWKDSPGQLRQGPGPEADEVAGGVQGDNILLEEELGPFNGRMPLVKLADWGVARPNGASCV